MSGNDAEEGLEQRGRPELEELLKKLMSEVDEEGLEFLIDQALVLIHNRKVSEINERLQDAQVEFTSAKRKTKKPSRKPRSMEVEIVERGDGRHFFIVVNNFRIYFTLDEMRSLVKICHGSENETAAALRLYSWFKRFRSDFLVDGGVGSPKNPYLADLYGKLVSTYKPREDE
jgi:hypothetical protein